MSAPLDIRPDIDQAAADFAELRVLSERFGFDLPGALNSLADSLTPVWACDVDAVPAPGTNYLVARYKLAERLQGALAALRVVARHSDGDFRKIGQNSPPVQIGSAEGREQIAPFDLTSQREAPSAEDRPDSPRPPAECSHVEGLESALARIGFLPTAECPVWLRPLGKSGFGLFLYLETGLDLQTLGRLANCNDRAGLIRRALAEDRPFVPLSEMEITPEMIEAGLSEYCATEFVQSTEETVRQIFLAMYQSMGAGNPKGQ